MAPSPAGPGPSNLNTDNQVRRRGCQRCENNTCLFQGIWAPPSIGTHRISPLPSEAKQDSRCDTFFQSIFKDVFSCDMKVGCYALGLHAPSFPDHCFSVMEYSSETLTLAFSWYFMYGYDVTDLMCLTRSTSQKSCRLSLEGCPCYSVCGRLGLQCLSGPPSQESASPGCVLGCVISKRWEGPCGGVLRLL